MQIKQFCIITKGKDLKTISREIQKALDQANSLKSSTPKVVRNIKLKR